MGCNCGGPRYRNPAAAAIRQRNQAKVPVSPPSPDQAKNQVVSQAPFHRGIRHNPKPSGQ